MKRPFHLVPDHLSHDTVTCLEQLLKDASSGQLLGIAFAAMYRNRQYIVNTAGEATRNPTFARGMTCALDDHLGEQIRHPT